MKVPQRIILGLKMTYSSSWKVWILGLHSIGDGGSKPVMKHVTAEETIVDVLKIGDFFRTAQFQKAISLLQNKLV